MEGVGHLTTCYSWLGAQFSLVIGKLQPNVQLQLFLKLKSNIKLLKFVCLERFYDFEMYYYSQNIENQS